MSQFRPVVCTLVLVIAVSALACGAEAWQILRRETGKGNSKLIPFQVNTPTCQLTYLVARNRKDEWGNFSLSILDSRTRRVVMRVHVGDDEIPRDLVRGLFEDDSERAVFRKRIMLKGQNAYLMQVSSRGVEWGVQVETPIDPPPGSPEPESPVAERPLSDEERAVAALKSCWSTLGSWSPDNTDEGRQFTVEVIDWRVRYVARPKGSSPSLTIDLKNLDTGKLRTVVVLSAADLAQTTASRKQASGRLYMYEPGHYELLVDARDMDWATDVEVPDPSAYTRPGAARTPSAPVPVGDDWPVDGGTTGGGTTDDGWDSWGGKQDDGLHGFE